MGLPEPHVLGMPFQKEQPRVGAGYWREQVRPESPTTDTLAEEVVEAQIAVGGKRKEIADHVAGEARGQ